MAPVIRNEKLLTISDRIGFPDDVTIGFIIGKCDTTVTHMCCPIKIAPSICAQHDELCNCIPLFSGVFAEYLLKVPLTVVDEFHSHLEPLNQIPMHTFRKQVLFIHSLTGQWTICCCAEHNLIFVMKNSLKFFVSFLFIQQISYSYAVENNLWNVIKIDGFNEQMDPTRFFSLHCHLFPHLKSCSSLSILKWSDNTWKM